MPKNPTPQVIQTMDRAWLVRWVFAGDDKLLYSRHGIKNKLIDILGMRTRFDNLNEIIQGYYIDKVLTLEEKIPFQKYQKGWKSRKDFFELIPTYSSYQSNAYRNVLKNNNKENRAAWQTYPKYYEIGHNPSIQIIQVNDVTVSKLENGSIKIECNIPLVGNGFKKEVYTVKK